MGRRIKAEPWHAPDPKSLAAFGPGDARRFAIKVWSKTMILIIIIAFFLCLVVLAIKYDDIIPPIKRLFKSAYLKVTSEIPLNIKRFLFQSKMVLPLIGLGVIFLSYNIIKLSVAIPDFANLTKLTANTIQLVRETERKRIFHSTHTMWFRVNNKYYLSYKNTRSSYNSLKDSITKGDGLVFWITKDNEYIYQIASNEKTLLSYNSTVRIKKKDILIDIVIQSLFVFICSIFLLYNLRKNNVNLQNLLLKWTRFSRH